MRWLLFLSRLAFICGIFFLLSVSLLIKDWTKDDAITSTIITIGYIMGLVIVPSVNLCYLVVLFVKRRISIYVPLWLIISNILFLFILIFYIFYLNDPYYHQK
ncbi:MAG TPA: hypothetical protein VJU78_00270 [Chitinophagaceae bacterium]|nr:hypothetical protein [Chitinophagaceae bacterium]